MSILTPKTRMPVIHSTKGRDLAAHAQMITTSASDTHTVDLYPGQWLVGSTNSYIGVASGENDADFVIQAIYDQYGRRLDRQHVTAAQANATAYIVSVIPIGGIIFKITEDGLTTPITDANAGPGIYADIVVANPSATDQATADANPFYGGIGTIQIDSNTVSSTAGTLTVELLGLAPDETNAYNATAGSQRTFLAQVRSPGQSL